MQKSNAQNEDARLDADSRSQDFFSSGNGLFPAAEQLRAGTEAIYASKNGEAGGELKKLDSFGRWMDKEMGRVPFYITCNNRIACSEVCEFEYVQKPSTIAAANATCAEDEFGLLIRLSKLLSSGAERKWSGSVVNCEKCKLKDLFHSLIDDKEGCWKRITELLYEAHEGCQGLRILDERGQGIIHLAAALGYEWAISPIVTAGMSRSFRDAHGRTALHFTLQYITLCLVVFDASAIQGCSYSSVKILCENTSGQSKRSCIRTWNEHKYLGLVQ
ncbi:calmodulin-binding transcription activator 2-like protein isoform X2 [Tanacetum coccineum]